MPSKIVACGSSLAAAVLIAGAALRCVSCGNQPIGQADDRASVSPSPVSADPAPLPGDAAYIAEDPRLSRLVGKPGPAATLQALDGTVIDVASNYGIRPVYLKLWASYCIPCRAQMPKFEKIHRSVGDRMQVIAVNAGVGDAAKVKSFVAKTGIHMPVAIDDGSLGAWLRMQETIADPHTRQGYARGIWNVATWRVATASQSSSSQPSPDRPERTG